MNKIIQNRPRIIPVILLDNSKMIKTENFKKPIYIGDPINAVKIFNEKSADELIVIDKSCSPKKTNPNYSLLSSIASQAFMPLAYGGGITNINQIGKILSIGFEKIIINTSLLFNPSLVSQASNKYGSQAIVASLDIDRGFFRKYKVCFKSGKICKNYDLITYIKYLENLGVGEIFINSIHREGTYLGYDIELIKVISDNTKLPVVSYGGAGNLNDFRRAIEIGHVSAVAASSMFIFLGKRSGILINFPDEKDLYKEGIYHEK